MSKPYGFAIWVQTDGITELEVVKFLIECPDCHVGFDNLSEACETCEGSGEVRNPALEWQEQCSVHKSQWMHSTRADQVDPYTCVRILFEMMDTATPRPIDGCGSVWVALGVTP